MDQNANALTIAESSAPVNVTDRLREISQNLSNHSRNYPGGHHAAIVDHTIRDIDLLIEQLTPPGDAQQPSQG